MVIRRRVCRDVRVAYAVVCVTLTALVFSSNNPNALIFYGWLVATFPFGLVGSTLTYVLFFGRDPRGIVALSAFVVMWLVIAAAQLFTVRALTKALCRKAGTEDSLRSGGG
jgi:hypothetical protein